MNARVVWKNYSNIPEIFVFYSSLNVGNKYEYMNFDKD